MRVVKPEPGTPNHESIFQSPRWVKVFHYVMNTGMTPYEVEDLIRSYMEEKRKVERIERQMSFEELNQGVLL